MDNGRTSTPTERQSAHLQCRPARSAYSSASCSSCRSCTASVATTSRIRHPAAIGLEQRFFVVLVAIIAVSIAVVTYLPSDRVRAGGLRGGVVGDQAAADPEGLRLHRCVLPLWWRWASWRPSSRPELSRGRRSWIESVMAAATKSWSWPSVSPVDFGAGRDADPDPVRHHDHIPPGRLVIMTGPSGWENTLLTLIGALRSGRRGVLRC